LVVFHLHQRLQGVPDSVVLDKGATAALVKEEVLQRLPAVGFLQLTEQNNFLQDAFLVLQLCVLRPLDQGRGLRAPYPDVVLLSQHFGDYHGLKILIVFDGVLFSRTGEKPEVVDMGRRGCELDQGDHVFYQLFLDLRFEQRAQVPRD